MSKVEKILKEAEQIYICIYNKLKNKREEILEVQDQFTSDL